MGRNSILNIRHKELGCTLDGETWNDMPMPWSYHTDAHDEVVAVRSRAGLCDVSGLNIVNVNGPDAEKVLDMLVAKDITKLEPGTSILAAETDESGAICDDIMIIRDSATAFRLSHGSGKTPENLKMLSAGKDVTIEPDLDAHVLALQGPKSLAILAPHVTSFDLATLPYFKHRPITLFGKEVFLARGGYSGERGYEVYCKAKDAIEIWDKILEVGKPFGAIPSSWNTLELTRIEAALLFFPFEMPQGTTPWEINMGWGVDLDKKGDYIGKAAVLASKGKERVKQAGLICKSATSVEAGAKIFKDGQEIGVVTSASFSKFLMLSLAMVHLKPEYTTIGTAVEVVGSKQTVSAYVAPTPFYDPMRLRTHG